MPGAYCPRLDLGFRLALSRRECQGRREFLQCPGNILIGLYFQMFFATAEGRGRSADRGVCDNSSRPLVPLEIEFGPPNLTPRRAPLNGPDAGVGGCPTHCFVSMLLKWRMWL